MAEVHETPYLVFIELNNIKAMKIFKEITSKSYSINNPYNINPIIE